MSTERLSNRPSTWSRAIGGAVLAATAIVGVPRRAAAADSPPDVSVLVLRENGVGAASTAQQYIDLLMEAFARVNGWASANGKYHTDRSAAEAFVAASKPSYGFLSLGAYLGLRSKYELTPVGKARIGGGGEQYFVISKTASSLADCKGKSLASNHVSDARFIDKVVLGKDAELSDFTVDATRRPLQTLKKITRGEAVCALVDDAQLAELDGMEGAEGVKPVWSSAKLPAVVVVAFPGAESKTFAAKLNAVCQGQGKSACDKAGVKALSKASPKEFVGLQAAYDG